MIKRLLLALPLLLLVACGAKAPDKTGAMPAKGGNAAGQVDAGDGHGTPHALAKLTAFGREFSVVQMGDIHAGEEAAVELEFASGKDRLTTVRAWIGVESGEGSTKGKLDIEDTANMHGHLDVPDPIPAGSKLWLSFDHEDKQETYWVAYQ